MLPLLFSANDYARNGNRRNHAGDKSHVHFQNLFDKTASVVSIQRKLPRNFLQSKTPAIAELSSTACACFGYRSQAASYVGSVSWPPCITAIEIRPTPDMSVDLGPSGNSFLTGKSNTYYSR